MNNTYFVGGKSSQQDLIDVLLSVQLHAPANSALTKHPGFLYSQPVHSYTAGARGEHCFSTVLFNSKHNSKLYNREMRLGNKSRVRQNPGFFEKACTRFSQVL